jgi:splicing factor 3B subunit 1
VQENCIDLVGRIADRGAEYVSTKEWIRICFALLDLLKAHKKAIRRAAVNTFGYIAKAIGPQVCMPCEACLVVRGMCGSKWVLLGLAS